AKRQAELRAALSQTTDMRPGSLVERCTVEIHSEIEALVGAPVNQLDFEAIEVAARREALRIAGLAVAPIPEGNKPLDSSS
ncbi:MAG: hypothetical protein ACLQCB_17410, partial [Spirochaetia bacterium]